MCRHGFSVSSAEDTTLIETVLIEGLIYVHRNPLPMTSSCRVAMSSEKGLRWEKVPSRRWSRGAPVPHTPPWRGMSGRVDDRRMAPKRGAIQQQQRADARSGSCTLEPAVLHVTRAVPAILRSVRDLGTSACNKVAIGWRAGRSDHDQLPQLPLRCVEMERSIKQAELTNDGRGFPQRPMEGCSSAYACTCARVPVRGSHGGPFISTWLFFPSRFTASLHQICHPQLQLPTP